MPDTVPLEEALPDLLATQLLAADLYATFLKYSTDDEQELWRSMLCAEFRHIKFIGMLIEEGNVPKVEIPPVKIEAFRDLYTKARFNAGQSAFERTLWALRMEHAEIDFGLETFASSVVSHSPDTRVYPGPTAIAYKKLLQWAERYKGAREIAIQIARIEEHIPQCTETGASAKR